MDFLQFLKARLPAVRGVRSAPRTVGAVFMLFLWIIFPGLIAAHAVQPDRDCVHGERGKRICLNVPAVPVDVVSITSDNNDLHPALIRGTKPVQFLPVVQPIPIDHFLTHYFERRIDRSIKREPDVAK